MTQQEKRIKIAEWEGIDCDPEEAREWKSRGQWMVRVNDTTRQLVSKNMFLPDYFTDLNAIHEAVIKLDSDQIESYCRELARITYKGGYWHGDFTALTIMEMVKATTEERSESFGLALKLWE